MPRPASLALVLILVVPVGTAQASNPRATSKRRTAQPAGQSLEPPAALEQPSSPRARRQPIQPAATAAPAEPRAATARPQPVAIDADAETSLVTRRILRSARRIGLPTIGPRYPVGPASPIR
jgi:hypothetical protein